jgi:hypothetical protein
VFPACVPGVHPGCTNRHHDELVTGEVSSGMAAMLAITLRQ